MTTRSNAVALEGDAAHLVTNEPGSYRGITVRETGAVALVLRLWDNDSAVASGTIIDIVSLASGGVLSSDIGPVQLTKGLFIERVTGGAFEGSVRIG